MIVQNNPTPWVGLALVILVGAVVLGVLVTDKKPFESSAEMYAAYATATTASLNASSLAAQKGATETPRAFKVQQSQTKTAALAYATQTVQSGEFQVAQTRQASVAQAAETARVLSIQSAETRAAVEAQVTQTTVAALAQATAASVQQTATQAAVRAALAVAQGHATETAVSIDSQNMTVQGQATQTAVMLQQALAAQVAAATATAIAIAPVREKEERADISNQQMVLFGSAAAGILFLSASLGIHFMMRGRARVSEANARMYREQRHTLEVKAAIEQQAQRHVPPAMRLLPDTKRTIKEPRGGHERAA